ncbi:hypothetical protein FHX14_001794 [Rhizobium sp. BK619]|uniref:hypothetical protein n=1 Tax=Rhizobium sp. BK619 TaxID=2586989 RepID=UPI001609F4C9|nr:hypothetical protein [Rhizobium sp. BK619]MBB3645615.1 hypothetical protein [Rhizobium sp. BK619]
MTEDISDEDRELEQRLRDKWRNEEKQPRSDGQLGVPIEYHFYSRELPNGRGGADTYWRFDRIEGADGFIHREFNSKRLATMELDKLRKAGFTVHVRQTPEALTLEAQAEQRRKIDDIFESSKNTSEITEALIAAGRKSQG